MDWHLVNTLVVCVERITGCHRFCLLLGGMFAFVHPQGAFARKNFCYVCPPLSMHTCHFYKCRDAMNGQYCRICYRLSDRSSNEVLLFGCGVFDSEREYLTNFMFFDQDSSSAKANLVW